MPLALTREVGLGVLRGPVVRRLRGGVHDQLDVAGVLGEDALDAVGVADVDLARAELVREALGEQLATCGAVDASAPKKRARMSFSSPTTS